MPAKCTTSSQQFIGPREDARMVITWDSTFSSEEITLTKLACISRHAFKGFIPTERINKSILTPHANEAFHKTITAFIIFLCFSERRAQNNHSARWKVLFRRSRKKRRWKKNSKKKVLWLLCSKYSQCFTNDAVCWVFLSLPPIFLRKRSFHYIS